MFSGDVWQAVLLALGMLASVGVFIWRIDARLTSLETRLNERFAAANEMRVQVADTWTARCAQHAAVQDGRYSEMRADIDRARDEMRALRQAFDDQRVRLVEEYVPKEAWLAHVADLNLKLDRLAARLGNSHDHQSGV